MKTLRATHSTNAKRKQMAKKLENGIVFRNNPNFKKNHLGMKASYAKLEHPEFKNYEGSFAGIGTIEKQDEDKPAVFFTSEDTMREAIKDNGGKEEGPQGRLNSITTLGSRVNTLKLNTNGVADQLVDFFQEDLTKDEKENIYKDGAKVVFYLDTETVEEEVEYKGKSYPVEAYEITGISVKRIKDDTEESTEDSETSEKEESTEETSGENSIQEINL